MNVYTLASIILSLAVLIGYINQRFIQVQSTIAIMVGSLLISLVLIILHHTGVANIADQTASLLLKTDFHSLLINGMLSFLLFAGALTIDFDSLKKHKLEIGLLASVGTIFSAVVISLITYYALPLLGLHLPYLYCFLFGALISPTDPIAVLATFKQIGAPKDLETCVAGESLFNDGVGIVLFITVFQLTFNSEPITFSSVSLLFLQQAIGGIGYGLVLGVISFWLMQNINDPKNSILVTLMTVTGGYSLALGLDISGALAMVVAGIYIGHKVRHADGKVKEVLTLFWEVIDEILNAVLFLLIGFELLAIDASVVEAIAALCFIPIVLLVRLCTVAIPMKLIQLRRSHHPYTIAILTWGGLRGGLAVALALSLPPSQYRDLILAMTYAVVAFAVIVQGLTIGGLAKAAKKIKH